MDGLGTHLFQNLIRLAKVARNLHRPNALTGNLLTPSHNHSLTLLLGNLGPINLHLPVPQLNVMLHATLFPPPHPQPRRAPPPPPPPHPPSTRTDPHLSSPDLAPTRHHPPPTRRAPHIATISYPSLPAAIFIRRRLREHATVIIFRFLTLRRPPTPPLN